MHPLAQGHCDSLHGSGQKLNFSYSWTKLLDWSQCALFIRGQVCCRLGGGKIFGPKKFSGVGENFFANLGVGDGLFEPKGGVKRILLKGELKIFQQRGAKLPLGHTLNWGVQMKKISFGGGKKNFSYGILNTCPRMLP